MSEELTPITRIEEYLDAIVDGGTPPLEDITRVETFLEAIYNNTPCALTPVTRIEMYLGKISGQDIELPEPVTRVEMYLASIAGMDVVLPDEPVTRIEEYLDAWANGGSPEYDTVTGSYVSFVTARSAPLKELVVDINPVQSGSGDPSPNNVRPISGWTGCEIWDDPKYGGLINWNQLVNNGNFETANGWNGNNTTSKTVSNNIMTFLISTAGNNQISRDGFHTVIGHKFLATCDVNSAKNTTCRWQYSSIAEGIKTVSITANTWTTVANVFNSIGDNGVLLYYLVSPSSLAANDTIQFRNFMCIDLTQLFGATKADEIYAMEQTETGTGVAYFKSLFSLSYYDYNAGTETNVSAVNGDPYGHYQISWQTEAGTVYGGAMTINEDGSGVLKSRPYYASYNGETLVGPWVSSMDKYVSGATPTTGAQVVDLGGTETSTNLTPGQVTALLGQNYVWADTGDVSVTYYYPGTTASPIVGVGTVNNMVI